MELRTFSHLPRTRPDFVSFYFERTALGAGHRPARRGHAGDHLDDPLAANRRGRRGASSDQITFEGFLA